MLLLVAFAVIFAFSGPFEYASGQLKPTLLVTTLLLLCTGVAFWALGQATGTSDNRTLLMTVVLVAVSLRLIGLFTCPILEIDYYRYLWDGKVIAQGVSPYQYSPSQIIKQSEDTNSLATEGFSQDSDLATLVELAVASPSNNAILKRIHFSEYSTLYPPVSQVVFGAAMKWLPASASVEAHIFFIKATLVGFDLMILAIILWMLRHLKIHTGWSIAYAWNPLVVKEISNGGHLDSIAAFFLVLSIALLVKWLSSSRNRSVSWLPGLSGVCLGLGVGAKLFPIVLFPALLVSSARVGWSRGLLFGAAFSAAAGLSLYPMYHSINHAEQNDERRAVGQSVSEDTTEQTPPIHKKEESTPQADDVNPFGPQLPGKKEGLTSFLSRWRMNDVIFSGIYENFKPTLVAKSDLPDDQRFPAWYVISTPEFRSWAKQQWESRFPDSSNWAFSMARVLTLGPFCLFYLWQLVAIYRRRPAPESEGEESTSLEFNRLVWILVLFLFLQPTVNPWYWVWVAPLTVLTKNRGWILAGGLLLVYYSRFWFESLPESFEIAGYSGVGLFDHGVAWIEFAAVIGVLVITGAYKAVKQ